MNSAYIASVINSTLRSTTPILLAALGCAMCSQVGVFNVALEAQMLIACFTSIAVDYYTSSVLLSVLAGVLSGAVEPLGAGLTILAAGLVVPALPYLLSFAAGAMLYVVVEELIPEMSQGEHSNVGTLTFALGFTLMMALDVALG